MESNQSSKTSNNLEPKEMSYNETLQWMAKNTGGKGTNVYSNTDAEEIKKKKHSVE